MVGLEGLEPSICRLSENDSSDNGLIAQHSGTGRPLGSDEFIKKLEVIYDIPLAPKRPGRKSKEMS